MFLDRSMDLEKRKRMHTCKWCYLQVIPNLEDRHTECLKKMRKQRRIRKANLERLASASDRRNARITNEAKLIVIGSRKKRLLGAK